MNYITSFIGEPPEYWKTCLEQIRLFTEDFIWCITDNLNHPVITDLQTLSNIKIISYDEVKSDIFNETYFKNKNKFIVVTGLKGRQHLFMRSIERFFLCENLIKKYDLKDNLFLEIDNMIYDDASKHLNSFRKTKLACMFNNHDECSTGIMYIQDSNSLCELNNFFIYKINNPNGTFISEMKITSLFAKQNKNIVQFLPVHTKNSIYPPETCSESSNYNCIFDSAPIGIYLHGFDTYHTGGKCVKYLKSSYSLIDYTKYKFIWKPVKKNVYCPFVIIEDNVEIPIFNLHVHSKNLKEAFSLKDD